MLVGKKNKVKRVLSVLLVSLIMLVSDLGTSILGLNYTGCDTIYAKNYIGDFAAPKKDVQFIYKFFMDKGLSSAVACGIIGNIATENTSYNLTSDDGSRYGLFQWMDGRYNNIKARKDHETLEGQCQYAWEEMKKDCKDAYFNDTDFSGTTWKEFKKLDDPVEAAKIFMVCFERCPYEGHPTGYKYCCSANYQGYDKRIKHAKLAFKVLDGTEIEGVVEDVENSTADVLGMEKAQYISEKYDSHTLSDYKVEDSKMDGLSAEERVMVSRIQDRLSSGETIIDGTIKKVRTAFMLFGILIVVYALVLFLAFWFDSYNPFFEISFLKFISFGRYYAQTDLEEQGVEGMKALSLKGVLIILAMGTFFSVFILSGKAFMLIDFVFTKLQLLG